MLAPGVLRMGIRLVRQLAIAIPVVIVLLWVLLPSDHFLRLWARFNLSPVIDPTLTTSQFYTSPVPYPVDTNKDVVLIVKSGYGTRHRLHGWLDLIQRGLHFDNFLFVADFDTDDLAMVDAKAEPVIVHNVANMTMHRVMAQLNIEEQKRYPRIEKYTTLEGALKHEYNTIAEKVAQEFGWEMDAMKFIPSLELAWTRYPKAKWYLLADDDTYLIRPSLEQFLGHLDSSKPLYVGNAVGAWNGRFAHGGSTIVVSRPALAQLFNGHPDVVQQAYVTSLTTLLGDHLVTKTFHRIGLYLKEGYSRFFNGEPPASTKIRHDRMCDPIISYHHIKDPEAMMAVHDVFGRATTPPRWLDTWRLKGAPTLQQLEKQPIIADWDHVGGLDEYTHSGRADTAEACMAKCTGKKWGACLAWTFIPETKVCNTSPWMIVGQTEVGRMTGVNTKLVRKLAKDCLSSMNKV
ncbi:uncharacterized protein PG986_006582 [Apiospora aurea]|uniref:N-acetylgalactosaminide beta-1,3-galactosyltransferase n=1 Tax=Apiospora aurea TaxID=335848 RepID=A0ABR1QKV0_9PEZI